MLITRNVMIRILATVLVAGLACWSGGNTSVSGRGSVQDELERGFLNPPASARPRVWWHWMNGNITKEGIRADLEWMKRVGIGGFQNFDAALQTPQIVEKRLAYMTPEWKDAFKYAATLADQLGLEMAIAGSPGWSETGGPWVPPAQAMKKFVWSETRVEGGRRFTGALPEPPSATGPFQNIKGGGGVAALFGEPEKPKPEYYADSAVIAFRVPDVEEPLSRLQPKITASGGQFDISTLTDGDYANATPLPKAPMGEKAWIQFEFARPQAIHAFTLGVSNVTRNPFGPPAESGQELEASVDGRQFRTIATVPGGGAVVNTVSFSKVTARFFRVTFKTLPNRPLFGFDIPGFNPPPPPTTFNVAELVLHTGPRINRAEEKAAFAILTDLYSEATPVVSATEVVRKSDVIDLTSKMRSDGTLDWTPPNGQWVVIRSGYSLLGVTNHPASPEATGLEVDKLNRGFVKNYLDNYLGQYKDVVGELMGRRGLQYMITDSWEAGAQNWTDEMISEFSRRRGYDLRPWLPVLTGRVVESSEASERFLWDFRKTIGELTTEYHYEQIGASLRERGMGRYTESHEVGRAMIADGMDVKRGADIPMSAMWTPGPGFPSLRYEADIRESASVAHIYGQNLAAAESLTAAGFGGSAYSWSPETLKPTADLELASGLNRFVIHTSVHQPASDKLPGLSLGPFGQWFTRHETWAEQAGPWISYLSRSCYMLQQGRFAADVIYFYGEDSNITALFGEKPPPVPDGYSFDYVNSDALVNRLSVDGNSITTPSGMRYRLLALDPNSRYMSLEVLRKIRDLVNAGASVAGSKPVASPSLVDDQKEFQTIAGQLWGAAGGSFGKGKVYGSRTLAEAIGDMQVAPDFSYTKPRSDTKLLFVHRKLNDGEVYWVNNRNNRHESLEATFRVEGKAAELWHPETGRIEPAGYRIADGRTTVPLRLAPMEAVFIVFRKPAVALSRSLPVKTETRVAGLDGAWEVGFQPDRGAPERVVFDKLISWSQNADTGVKYFSGTATYTQTVNAPAGWFVSGAQLWLDLGEVKNLAEVAVNGRNLGVIWKTPFRVDISEALKPGANTVEVKVTNLWVNRLIGDQQPDAGRKYSYAPMPFYQANSPLRPSGLLGPVQLIRVGTE
ncbi:MAG: glycoside hydrolase [Acidobacteriota bacterium]|nr:MAG: glycoside hydrolase [Acidobacteriota bacterium]